MNKDKIKNFIEESYRIEWEDINISDEDVKALITFIEQPITEKSVLEYHRRVAAGNDRAGKYRKVQVYIWHHTPPAPEVVPVNMKSFFQDIDTLTSRFAHNRFELIHPFNDYNGRLGRAIRLHIAIKEWYNFWIPFLHQYYYQTLEYLQ